MQNIMEILVVIFLELIEGPFSVSLSDHLRYNASIRKVALLLSNGVC